MQSDTAIGGGNARLGHKSEQKGGQRMKKKYSKLLGRIKECGYTQETLAKAIDKNKSTISAKLNGHSPFTTKEIDDICKVLNISNDEIGDYFFAA